ncbi:BglG family transcription antiterminator [Utexia brackfieldae]|uniref:BglG family transcription antiterminator n=1 Tax=Utexia brackfieldae TaxID=3074108 RepID=UPI00370D389D
MVADKRIHQVLDAVVHNPSLTGIELEQLLGLSRKQLSYTLQKVNDYLTSHQLEPIQRFKTGKLAVSSRVIDTFKLREVSVPAGRYLYSETERSQLILFYLLIRTERQSLIHLSSALQVSQNTIINDMKKIQCQIKGYHLQIHYDRQQGYHLRGFEINKRHLLLILIRQIMAMPIADTVLSASRQITGGRLAQVPHVFTEIEKQRKILFTDEQLRELTYYMGFILHRIASGKMIQTLPDNYAEVTGSRDFQLIQKLLVPLGITDANEQIFLTVLIQSSNIQTLADKYFHLEADLLESVVTVIDIFQQISCITFKDKNELIERIYQHWKSAYYRIRYQIANINSVYEIVLQDFGHLHEMVRRAVAPFERLLQLPMPDEEIAFITVLFGGWLTREGMLNQIKSKKVAIVVSENSATLSTYLYLTLQVLLPELHFAGVMSKRQYDKYQGCYDIVFATCHLHTAKLLFMIQPGLHQLHKQAFRHQVISVLQGVDPHFIQVEQLLCLIEQHSQIGDRKALHKALSDYLYPDHTRVHSGQQMAFAMPALADLMPASHIQIADAAGMDWSQAIALAAQPLLTKQWIEPGYVACIIEKISLTQPYILLAEGLIIAHAGIDDGVNLVGMSLLKLSKPIDIAGYLSADLIVVLATPDLQQHLKALGQLNELLAFYQGASQIRVASSAQEIGALFASYS